MKNIVLAVLIFLCMVSVSYAQKTCTSSGLLTSSAVVTANPGTFCGIIVIADGTNSATATAYDNNVGVATGKVLWKSTAAAGEYLIGGVFPNIVRSDTGIYVAISGTGASAIVYYNAQ